jgi:urease accessory protein
MHTASTSIRTELIDGRLRILTTAGLLRPMQLSTSGAHAQVALVATGSLLHPGDEVNLEVAVGAGTSLDVIEPAGTVAYSGGPSAWHVRIILQDKANLVWHGEPFVVAHGAEVDRSTTITLGSDARCLLRETLVLGRTGESPGHVRSRTRATDPAGPLLVEDMDLGPSAQSPGILGQNRILDTVLDLAGASVGVVGRPPGATLGDARAVRMVLERGGTVHRSLASDLHLSDLAQTVMSSMTSRL